MPTWAALLLALVTTACGGSAYDRSWIDREVARATGYAPRPEGPPGPASLPPGVREAEALSPDEAVATALWNSTRFRAELARLGLSLADLSDAAALPNPTLSVLAPIGPRQLEASLTYPIVALLQRPSRVAAAEIDVERTARSLVEVALDLARDVRIAHAELALIERRLEARRGVERSLTSFAELTEVRLRQGDASQLEARGARAEALTAADQTTRTGQDAGVARARLRRLVGLGESPLGGLLGATLPPTSTQPPPLVDELARQALIARPDVRASKIAIAAAGERLGWERWRVVQLVARLDRKPIGARGGAPSLYLPGGQLDVPIFNWNPGGRERAEASVEQAAARYLAAREDVVTDVRVAHAQLEQAIGSLARWREGVLPRLDQNANAAQRAFEHGGETYLVVIEAVRRWQEAHLREIELEGDVVRARAALDRAVGRRVGP
jgi:outer membrane protein, heavy metal efflux system